MGFSDGALGEKSAIVAIVSKEQSLETFVDFERVPAKTWSDRSLNLAFASAKAFHRGNRLVSYPRDRAAPACVRRADDACLFIGKQNRSTVCGEDSKGGFRGRLRSRRRAGL